jgi:SAM-dependent methyltransferase
MRKNLKSPFDTHHSRYEAWFDKHKAAYHSELLAVYSLLPRQGLGIEIGVGTGRFAGPLGVQVGLDPSGPMLHYTVKKDVHCVQGVAESLPFKKNIFDYALMVTSICFMNDPVVAFLEARRVLKFGGALIVGFINRNSALAKNYLSCQSQNIFYAPGIFYSQKEVEEILLKTKFTDPQWVNTLTQDPGAMSNIEPVVEGRGKGAFVIVKAIRPD